MTRNDLADPPRRQFDYMYSQIRELEKKNAMLLKALEAVLPVLWDGDPRRQESDPLCIQIRQAIAKCAVCREALKDE